MNDRYGILLVDDDESTRKTLTLILRKQGYETETAATGQEALEKARERAFHLAFLDLRLPDMEGVDLIGPLREMHPHIAVIMITGHASVGTAVRALHEGASGYITKPVNMDQLLAMARDALEKHRLIEAKQRAESHRDAMVEALRESEEKYRLLVDNAGEAIAVAQDGRLKFVNPKMLEVTGYSEDEAMARPFLEFVHPEDREMVAERHATRVKGDEIPAVYAFRIVDSEGKPRWLELNAVMIEWLGKPATLNFLTDITERRALETELRQAQKMEAIGRLAGGVAHDFNNMLTVILGYVDFALAQIDPAESLYHDIEHIGNAARRSADLTQQLLAFSRKQMVVPKVLDLSGVVARQMRILKRLLGEDIRIDFVPAESVWNIWIDPSQIDQILTNLTANARDAIAGVGTVTIETSNVTVDEASGHRDVDPGDYVMLSVEDTGSGMDSHTLEHIFEPFFTTKGVGEGTGMGLATVYGIVKQNDGTIQVDSEVGVGTVIRIYFPRFHQEAEGPVKTAAPTGGTETILVVEDEEQVLSLTRRILEQKGYTVLTTVRPERACALAEQYAGDIDLLLTDVVMPNMNGKELAARIREMNPAVKIVFMSGYTSDIVAERDVVDQGVEFIQKPFSLDELTHRVRQVLDR